jgi:ABC-type polysaccharide/polyol phosphate export permease
MPLAASASGVVSFAFGLIPLFGLMLIAFPSHISAWLLLIPVVALVQLVFSLGVSIGAAAINVFYRDLGNIARHALRFWFYLSPSLYGIEDVQKVADGNPLILLWYKVNPFTYILGGYRDLIYYGQAPDWKGLAAVTLGSIVLLALAILMFKRVEPQFAKVL